MFQGKLKHGSREKNFSALQPSYAGRFAGPLCEERQFLTGLPKLAVFSFYSLIFLFLLYPNLGRVPTISQLGSFPDAPGSSVFDFHSWFLPFQNVQAVVASVADLFSEARQAGGGRERRWRTATISWSHWGGELPTSLPTTPIPLTLSSFI